MILFRNFRMPAAGEGPMFWSCLAMLAIGIGTTFFISLYVVHEAYPVLAERGGLTGFLFIDPWAPLASPPTFGIVHAWVSTIAITTLCLALAMPFGFGIGVFVAEVAPTAVKAALRPFIDLLAGIPSVVYGFFGYVTIIPWFESHFGMVTGESILAAAMVLAVMVLPYIASTSAEAFSAVPRELKETAMTQGVTRWHAIRRIVIPCALPGMFAAVVLGLARALGETLAVMMLAGNSVAVPTGPLDRGQPITALIATELGEAGVGSEKYHALFAAGLVLFVVIVLINGVITMLKSRLIHRHAY